MLRWETVSPLLKEGLMVLMEVGLLKESRLVGGTSLSLQLGHRMSVDIDLFTDQPYGSVDFRAIEVELHSLFAYVEKTSTLIDSMGRSYIVGLNEQDAIKLDIFYSNEPFITPVLLEDGIRLASLQEIAAMKIDVVHRGGRKKDFWDIHEMLDHLSLPKMLDLHQQRHPYTHQLEEILAQLVDFSRADQDLDPICLQGKYWELVKYDILNTVAEFRAG